MSNRIIQVEVLSNRIEKYLPYVAVFVSVLAIGISVFQINQGIKHDKLQVKPKLELLMDYSQESNFKGVYLRNSGLGPAIIKKMETYFDGEKIDGWNFVKSYYLSLGLRRPDGFKMTTFPGGTNMKADTKHYIFLAGSENIFAIQKFAVFINYRLIFKIEYCSVYEECIVECLSLISNECPSPVERPSVIVKY